MEETARRTLVARALAAALLAAVLALALLERRSEFAQGLRAGRPVLAWLVLTPKDQPAGPALFLAVYQPVRRAMDVIHVPCSLRVAGGRPLCALPSPEERIRAAAAHLAPLTPAWKDWEGLPVWRGGCTALSDEPPLDARDWVLAHAKAGRSPSQDASSSWGPLERLLWALEVERLEAAAVRAAWLPPPEHVGPLLGRALSPAEEAPAPSQSVTVEVLNAGSQTGIASRAKNILRLGGVDVMSVGNAGGPRARTLVYDRVGRFEGARRVAELLGCPTAQALTQVDLKRLVDVTVVLAQDCPLP